MDEKAPVPASGAAPPVSDAPPATATAPAPAPPAADSFVRDPHKLIAYVVPFPAPTPVSSSASPPLRFVLYTPPPPPLLKPDAAAGDPKERTSAKVQRKWEEEVRAAHESAAPLLSWKGIRSRVTRGVNWAVGHTTSADLDFLTRIPRDGDHTHAHDHDDDDDGKDDKDKDTAALAAAQRGDTLAQDSSDDDSDDVSVKDKDAGKDGKKDPHTGHKHAPDELCRTVKLESMVLIYPPSMKMTEDELRAEFINSLMRTKSKAQRDAVIATGLLPVTAVLDWALVFVGWIFGGALEVDAIWMANSFRGAKTARSVTRRLASTDEAIKLEFVASDRADVLEEYLLGACISRNRARFNRPHWGIPAEGDVMSAIGWQASAAYRPENWEDETWERDQVVKDLQQTMKKAARGWDKWVDGFIKNPDKAVKR